MKIRRSKNITFLKETYLIINCLCRVFKNIVNQKEKLEYENATLREEYKIVKEDLRIARQECESLFRQMKTVVEQKQAEILNHKRETDDIIRYQRNKL